VKTKYNYDFLVFIGRFQPFHKGHQFVINEALKQGQYVIILCGSAHQPRSLRNPWSVEEREQMIRSCFSSRDNQRIIIAPLMDVLYNDELWIRNVQQTIESIIAQTNNSFEVSPKAVSSYSDNQHGGYKIVNKDYNSNKIQVIESPVNSQNSPSHQLIPKIGLIGHTKDRTSYYLKLFPQWSSIGVENYQNISSTPIRQAFFAHPQQIDTKTLPQEILAFLDCFTQSSDFAYLCQEWEFIHKYQQGWQSAPYPPTFVTVDAVVIQSGHILLVERKARPGKGQLALPGGFVRQSETLLQACLRELREETKLKIPEPVLQGSIVAQQVFDDPNRSSRGRTITQAFYFELKADTTLPKVKGSDDANHAFWLPLAQLDSTRLYEDHYFIVQKFLGLL
jgi:bifunctional NMN adenylyltransferase/nudix hydrolase